LRAAKELGEDTGQCLGILRGDETEMLAGLQGSQKSRLCRGGGYNGRTTRQGCNKCPVPKARSPSKREHHQIGRSKEVRNFLGRAISQVEYRQRNWCGRDRRLARGTRHIWLLATEEKKRRPWFRTEGQCLDKGGEPFFRAAEAEKGNHRLIRFETDPCACSSRIARMGEVGTDWNTHESLRQTPPAKQFAFVLSVCHHDSSTRARQETER